MSAIVNPGRVVPIWPRRVHLDEPIPLAVVLDEVVEQLEAEQHEWRCAS